MRGASLAALGCALVVGASLTGSARGDDGAPSALSSPSLTLTVSPSSGRWRLRIENTGDVPVRIAADPRLLVLDVTAPAGTSLEPATTKRAASKTPASLTVQCALPADARPATDEGRELVIPGHRSWSQQVDPLLYCFGPRERRALVSGATITAHFGWPSAATKAAPRAKKPASPTGPFAASPVGAAIGKVAPAKELVSAPFALGETVAFAVPTASAPEPSSPGRASLRVTMAESHDVARGADIDASVTVTNDGDQPALLLFRPETVRFAVVGPQGPVKCGGDSSVESPIRELYGTIGVKGHASLGLLLDAVCPVDTFDEPGIYRVTATLDTTAASARSIGLKTWDGESTAKAPLLLRVRTPRHAPTEAAAKPTLD